MTLLRRITRARALTAGERGFLGRYFDGSLDPDHIAIGVSIGHRCWSPYGNRISLTARHFVAGDPRKEVVLGDAGVASTFAHEALHVWQRQHGQWVTLRGIPLQAGYALGLCDPYRHDSSEDPREMLNIFLGGNIEQQGRIFERYVYASQTGGDTAAYRDIALHVAGAPFGSVTS